jgi:hypothetical protein
MKIKINLGLIVLILAILKIAGFVTWSWWWILSPIWIPFMFILFYVILFIILKEE